MNGICVVTQAETVRRLLEKQSTKKKEEENVSTHGGSCTMSELLCSNGIKDIFLTCFCSVAQPKLPSKPVVPHIRYINSTRLDGVGTTLSLPDGMDYPLQPQNNTRCIIIT